MEFLASTSSAVPNPRPATPIPNTPNTTPTKTHFDRFGFRTNSETRLASHRLQLRRALVTDEGRENRVRRFKWARIGLNVTEAQKESISAIPYKMTNRCQALLKQIFCFSDDEASLADLLADWSRVMKPRRCDWLTVLKHLKTMNHPLHLQVAELALEEDSFEPNIRDYTKLIHAYGKQNLIREAETTLSVMKARGFLCDQVTLTAFVDMYSKTGNLALAEQTFENIKLLGEPVDKRSYGSMVMAYIRAGLLGEAERLLREMDSLQVYAGSEVYKAVLRAYSMGKDVEGAQRVFGAAQLAGVVPDARLCGLVINACVASGRSDEARVAFENMRQAGIEPTDRCVALVLSGYESEERLQGALEFLVELERDGFAIGKEASETLASWFRRLGVVEEVELVLREFCDGRSSKVCDAEHPAVKKEIKSRRNIEGKHQKAGFNAQARRRTTLQTRRARSIDPEVGETSQEEARRTTSVPVKSSFSSIKFALDSMLES